MKKKLAVLFSIFIFIALSFVPIFTMKKNDCNLASAVIQRTIEPSIFIRTPTYSTFYNNNVFFIDDYDKSLKGYNITQDEFISQTSLSQYGEVVVATAENDYLIIVVNKDNKNTVLFVNLDDLSIKTVDLPEKISNIEHIHAIQTKIDISENLTDCFVVTITPSKISENEYPYILTITKLNFELYKVCKLTFNNDNNEVIQEIQNDIYKVFTLEFVDNKFNIVYFYGHSITYSTVLTSDIKNDTLTIATCQSPYKNLQNEPHIVSLASVNSMEIDDIQYFLVSYSENKLAREQPVNHLYSFTPSDSSTSIPFRDEDYEQCANTKYILTNNDYVIYPLSQTIEYKQFSYNPSAPEGYDKFPVITGGVENPTVSVSYATEDKFEYLKTITETSIHSSPWSPEKIETIPTNTDVIKVGTGYIESEQNVVLDYIFVVYTANNKNYKGFIKTEHAVQKTKIEKLEYDFIVAKVVPDSNLYSLPTKILGDSFTKDLVSAKIGQIKANSKVEVLDPIYRYTSNGSTFVKVIVNDKYVGYIELKNVIMPSSKVDFVKTNAIILKDGVKVYEEASSKSDVIAELDQDKMVYVNGVRNTKTGYTYITFNDEYGVERSGYIKTDYVKTDSWSTLQIIGCVLIAVNFGLLALILIFKKKHIGKYGQKYETNKKPNYKENKLLSDQNQ